MKVININKEIGCKVSIFPDGELHLTIDELDRKDPVAVVANLTSSSDIFLLMQLSDILNRQCVRVAKITIPYLMSMRCDRLFSLERPFTLNIVANIINSFNADCVEILEPHSDVSLRLIKNSKAVCVPFIEDENFVYCFPDAGACSRNTKSVMKHKPIKCSKVRDVETGRICELNIDDLGDYKEGMDIVVADDLCDGGGTFVAIAEKLRKLKPGNLVLAVTHAVQFEGILKVSKVFDKVFITNSHTHWTYLPDNVEMWDYESYLCI